MPRQLILSLGSEPRYQAEDFLVTASNEQAHALLTGWPKWPANGVLLVAPPGAGKTHLAHIWARQAGARLIDAEGLTGEWISVIGSGDAVAVDTIDGAGVSEALLFHLLNSVRERGAWLLLTSERAPGHGWPLLPDLASRLRALPRVDLFPPDDELVHAVLIKLFDDRQLLVESGVIDYLARRMERSLGAARSLVSALDDEALSLGRRVTRAVAARVLERLSA